jgi:hemoglobin-like flavoprotein
MNTEQISLIRSTWSAVHPAAHRVTGLFFARLYQLDPSLEPRMGRQSMTEVQRLLTLMDTAVCGLDRLPALRRLLLNFGRRYATCGIRPGDYATFGAAWLWAMGESLGSSFSPAARSAWTSFYGLVARSVRQGANQALALRETA